jgi:4-oxalomesaconate tautomerase
MVMRGVRCMLMRGGTSKGAYFLAADLPSDPAERDDFLLRVMGTPDPRQIDGIGGGHPLTSKVAIVAPAKDPRADVEYLFLQLGVGERMFAVERGLIPAPGDSVTTRIHLLNTDEIAVATFVVADGQPVYGGGTAISGVPGTASAIRLEFDGDAGASSLPTGAIVDMIDGVECTLIDSGMPVVVIGAADLGVSGHESCAELDANDELRDRLE